MSTLENKKGPGAEGPSNLAAANLPSGERPWEVVAKELGRNFLGPAEWRSGFNVDVGVGVGEGEKRQDMATLPAAPLPPSAAPPAP